MFDERGLVFCIPGVANVARTDDNKEMNLLTHTSVLLAQSAPAAQGVDDTQWMIYAIIAFAAALALVVLEAFVPSGGVLGILAGLLAIAGIVMFFMFDDMWGMVSMAVSLLALPFVIAGMLWVWPNTPIGRALTLEDQQERINEDRPSVGPNDPNAITVGLEGEALTELRPVGACLLNGQRIDCIAQFGVIESGSQVKVISVEGMTVKVKTV